MKLPLKDYVLTTLMFEYTAKQHNLQLFTGVQSVLQIKRTCLSSYFTGQTMLQIKQTCLFSYFPGQSMLQTKQTCWLWVNSKSWNAHSLHNGLILDCCSMAHQHKNVNLCQSARMG